MNFIPLDQASTSTFVRSFNGYTLKQPRGVASHLPLQLIFVADISNNSLVVLDSNLQFITNFTYPDMFTPWNLCFSADFETLYVVCDHGILRLNGDNALFRKPGDELRGCSLHRQKIISAACYQNTILEFDMDMNVTDRIELDVFGRAEDTFVIDFTIYNDLFYVIFLFCEHLLQTFDETGTRIRQTILTPLEVTTPLFITHHRGDIYITDRDTSRVACLNTSNDELSSILIDTRDREKCETDFCVIRSDRKYGIFYGIEFSLVQNCLIVCEML